MKQELQWGSAYDKDHMLQVGGIEGGEQARLRSPLRIGLQASVSSAGSFVTSPIAAP